MVRGGNWYTCDNWSRGGFQRRGGGTGRPMTTGVEMGSRGGRRGGGVEWYTYDNSGYGWGPEQRWRWNRYTV